MNIVYINYPCSGLSLTDAGHSKTRRVVARKPRVTDGSTPGGATCRERHRAGAASTLCAATVAPSTCTAESSAESRTSTFGDMKLVSLELERMRLYNYVGKLTTFYFIRTYVSQLVARLASVADYTCVFVFYIKLLF